MKSAFKPSILAILCTFNIILFAADYSIAKEIHWNGKSMAEAFAGDENAADYTSYSSIGPDSGVETEKQTISSPADSSADDSDGALDYDLACDTSDAWSRERALRHSMRHQAKIRVQPTVHQRTPNGCLLYVYYDYSLYCSPRPNVLDTKKKLSIEFGAVPDFMKYFCWNSEDHQWGWSDSRDCGVLPANKNGPMEGSGYVRVSPSEANHILGKKVTQSQ